jgi:hypothetical protein
VYQGAAVAVESPWVVAVVVVDDDATVVAVVVAAVGKGCCTVVDFNRL